MKKSLVALAALAVAGVASAQSSVTLFGVVDVAVSYYQTNSSFVGVVGTPALNFFGAPDLKQSQLLLSNNGYNSSRLGFRGTEDLGGGLAASFWLEAPITPDDGVVGVSTFSRRSTVSLSGGFGELRLGRDYVPTFWNDTVFDPFGTNGVGSNLIYTMNTGPRTITLGGGVNRGLFGNTQYVRASNSVGYFLPPNLGGFYGQVMYSLNEKITYDPAITTPVNNSRSGTYAGGRFGYANGPLDIAASYGQNTNSSDYYAGTTTNKTEIANLGASWDFGVVKLFGEISRTKNKDEFQFTTIGQVGSGDFKGDGYLLGATVPLGAGLIRVAWSHVKVDYSSPPTLSTLLLVNASPDPTADKFALGYVYNLSKRTALYATGAYVKNKNGAAFNTNSNYTTSAPSFTNNFLTTGVGGYKAKDAFGYDFGVRHAF